MNLNRLITLAVCLGVACLMLTGSALAGTTDAVNLSYAREVGVLNRDYTIPTNSASRAMNVIRSDVQDFFLIISVPGLFISGPASNDVTISFPSGGTGAVTSTLISNSGGTLRYFIDVTQSMTGGLPTMNVDTTGWVVRDTGNILGGGGVMNMTITTNDAATDVPFDTTGTASDGWLFGVFGVGSPSRVSTLATVDVATNRRNFVAGINGGDTTTADNGATFAISLVSGVLQANGTAYALSSSDFIDLTFTGDLSGITNFTFDPSGSPIVDSVTTSERTAGSTTLRIPGNRLNISATAVQVNVDGTTVLTARTLSWTVDLALSGGAGGPSTNNRNLGATATLTVWSLNGTVLIANFSNGNNAAFFSRFYLWNPSPVGGNVTARVYTLPLIGNPTTSTLLGTVLTGFLSATSGANIRLAEDILTPLAIALPYTANGGNLVVEITIEAANVSGLAQVFQPGSLTPFTSAPMVKIQ